MTTELAWSQWKLSHRATFLYTFDRVMRVLWRWDQSLTQPYLENLFGPPSTDTTDRSSSGNYAEARTATLQPPAEGQI